MSAVSFDFYRVYFACIWLIIAAPGLRAVRVTVKTEFGHMIETSIT